MHIHRYIKVHQAGRSIDRPMAIILLFTPSSFPPPCLRKTTARRTPPLPNQLASIDNAPHSTQHTAIHLYIDGWKSVSYIHAISSPSHLVVSAGHEGRTLRSESRVGHGILANLGEIAGFVLVMEPSRDGQERGLNSPHEVQLAFIFLLRLLRIVVLLGRGGRRRCRWTQGP
jgi:hypothetical protein